MSHPSFLTRETKRTKYGLAHKTHDGRWRVYQGRRISKRTGKRVPFYAYLSRLVWTDLVGPIPEGCDIHHGKGGKADDSIENLSCWPKPTHIDFHRNDRKTFAGGPGGVEVKTCTGACGRTMPAVFFRLQKDPSGRGAPYRRSACKKCEQARNSEWRRKRVAAKRLSMAA